MGNNVTFQSDIFESRAVMAAQMARVNNSILHCDKDNETRLADGLLMLEDALKLFPEYLDNMA